MKKAILTALIAAITGCQTPAPAPTKGQLMMHNATTPQQITSAIEVRKLELLEKQLRLQQQQANSAAIRQYGQWMQNPHNVRSHVIYHRAPLSLEGNPL